MSDKQAENLGISPKIFEDDNEIFYYAAFAATTATDLVEALLKKDWKEADDLLRDLESFTLVTSEMYGDKDKIIKTLHRYDEGAYEKQGLAQKKNLKRVKI